MRHLLDVQPRWQNTMLCSSLWLAGTPPPQPWCRPHLWSYFEHLPATCDTQLRVCGSNSFYDTHDCMREVTISHWMALLF